MRTVNRAAAVAAAIVSMVSTPAVADWSDPFEDLAAWRVITADGVRLSIAGDDGTAGRGARLDYDFSRGSGYGIIRREFSPPLEVPANYRWSFDHRGSGPRNTLEFKLVEKETGGSGESVWWVNQRDHEFPAGWSRMTLPKRRFSFAWGPSGGSALARIDAVEIVVTSFNGGRGSVWIDELKLESLPEVRPYAGTPRVEVSSRHDGGVDPLAMNNEGFLGWRSADGDANPTATIDFGEVREFGGLALEWEPDRGAESFTIDGALEAAAPERASTTETWTPLARIDRGNGGRDYLIIPNGMARRLRIMCNPARSPAEGTPGAVGLRSVRVLSPEFAESRNEPLKLMAADSPRGWFPRYWLGEGGGTYWTVVGAAGDEHEALLGEDGAVELAKQGPSVEPFIRIGQRLLTWHEADCESSLEEGYLPVPTVRRDYSVRAGEAGLRLEITCVADETDSRPHAQGGSILLVRYRLTNKGAARTSGDLLLALRPMQVNPIYQFLNTPGGAATVRQIRVEDSGIAIDDRELATIPAPGAFGAIDFTRGEIIEHLLAAELPSPDGRIDPQGLASAVAKYPFDLEPGGEQVVVVVTPFRAGERLPPLLRPSSSGAAFFDERLKASKRLWTDRLGRVEVSLPPRAQRWWDAARSNIAYILINRDGAGIQPGSRSYERTWIRDGSLTSAALLAFGFEREVADFLDWFAPFQYDDGKVPCCVDRRGPDPVPEHDSHGQYIYSVMAYHRVTGDNGFLRRHWDRMVKAAAYIERLRESRMTEEFRLGPEDKRVLYGLLPESISHEGYSAKPMHSYWDDLWALKGLEDAAEAALILREEAHASRLATLRDSFRATLADSIVRAMRMKRIDYIPGCAELGDFDATSTTIGLWPCDQAGSGGEGTLAAAALNSTFDRYWRFFVDRRGAAGEQSGWVNYTPYEWRTVGTMVRLGHRDRAHEIAEYFFADQRPRGWNHWAEVVWRDPRHPGFIGDMPHTWVGSDFINSFRAMFAFENDRARSMVLGAGLPLDWLLSDEGVSIRGLRTQFGELSLSARRDGPDRVRLEVGAGLRMPEGGLTLAPPEPRLIRAARVDGSAEKLTDGTIALPRVPVSVELEYAPAR